MKVLFVDQSTELQQKWIEPLRKEGWGVLRATSIHDASRMMTVHGESIQIIAVSESFVSFAEKWQIPFLIMTRAWTEKEILKHQNSAHSAFAYLKFSASVQEFKNALDARTRTPKSGPTLESYSDVMAKPEKTRHDMQLTSIRLEAPEILLGGTRADLRTLRSDGNAALAAEPAEEKRSATKLELVPDVESVALPEVAPVLDSADRTLMLEPTSIEEMAPGIELGLTLEGGLEETAESNFEPENYETPVYESPVYSASAPAFTMPSSSGAPSDFETLKSYLALREQDVAVLTGQVRSSQEHIHHLEQQLRVEKVRSTELQQTVQKQEQTIKNYDRDKQVELEVLFKQIEDLNNQLKERTDKMRTIDAKLRMTTDEVDKIKERVRVDIRRIRVREKELENQLEILKKDSSALLLARDEKILDLKRKLDLIEFNMELVQEQYSKERHASEDLRNRLKDAAHAMRQAGGFLENQ